MVTTAAEIDAHLAKFSGPQAKALLGTRDRIATALPGAQQVLAYGMPTFKIDGDTVVGFEGFRAHNSLFPYSGSVVAMVAEEVPDWHVSKGTIQFPLGEVPGAPTAGRLRCGSRRSTPRTPRNPG